MNTYLAIIEPTIKLQRFMRKTSTLGRCWRRWKSKGKTKKLRNIALPAVILFFDSSLLFSSGSFFLVAEDCSKRTEFEHGALLASDRKGNRAECHACSPPSIRH